MLGSPCSPCCASCTPSQIAGILNTIRAGSCVMDWAATGMRYQDSASFFDRPTTDRPWNAYIYKQQLPPPSPPISLALDLSYESDASVRFIAYGIEWRAEVVVSVSGIGTVPWPGTTCNMTMNARLLMNGISNWDRRYTPLFVGTPFVWQADKSFDPPAVFMGLTYGYSTTDDLSARCVLNSGYARDFPSWPSSLDWTATACNSGGTEGWYKCSSIGAMGALSNAPAISSSGMSFTFTDSPTTPIGGAYDPPFRWVDGVYKSPGQTGNISQGRLTRIGATLTL